MRRFRCSPRSLHEVLHGAHHRSSTRRARAKRRPARAAAERVAGRPARRLLLRRGAAAARRARRRGAAAPVRCPREALVSAVRRRMQCRQRCLPQRLRSVRSRRVPRPRPLAAAAVRSRTRSVCARSGSGSASWMRQVWRCSERWRRLRSMAQGVCALTRRLPTCVHSTHKRRTDDACVCVVEQREHGAIYERGAGASGEARISQRAAGSANGGGEGRTRAGASGSGGVSEGRRRRRRQLLALGM
jgi:hypothetical protein